MCVSESRTPRRPKYILVECLHVPLSVKDASPHIFHYLLYFKHLSFLIVQPQVSFWRSVY